MHDIKKFVSGLLQTTILESLGCIWFNRTETKDRETVAKKSISRTILNLLKDLHCSHSLICLNNLLQNQTAH